MSFATGHRTLAAFTRARAAPGAAAARGSGPPRGLGAGLALAGCGGPASTLDPAGRGAERIAELFWWLVGGSAVIWLAVVILAVAFSRSPPGRGRRSTARWLVVGGGAAFPTVVLAAVLVYGLALVPELVGRAPPGALRVVVSGEQWWWRVRYLAPGGDVPLANELHLPVGEPVELLLESPDVIHSLWIPALGGKLDLVPGRLNRLTLHPTRTGVYPGMCAEYCGTAHALMRLRVVVEEKEAFSRWLSEQARPAAAPAAPLAARGAALFLANGCAACHAVRGTPADGAVGPDLTHVGSRRSLGAGILPNDAATLRRWIARTHELKPGVLMPSFGMLPEDELAAITAYLEALR